MITKFKVLNRGSIVFCLLLLLSACNTPGDQGQDQSDKPNLTAAANYNVQLGLAYIQVKDMGRAKEKLLLAVQQAPRWPVALDGLAFYYQVTDDQKSAEQYYRKALDYDPKSGLAQNNYGTFLCRNGRYKEALRYLLAAANNTQYVNTSEANENVGLCYAASGDTTTAEQYFKKALDQNPESSTSLYELSRIYYQRGNYKLANDYFSRYNQIALPDAKSLQFGIEVAKHVNDYASVTKYNAQMSALKTGKN